VSGLDVHKQVWGMVEDGLSPIQALQVSTVNGIRALGLEADLGTIEPGKIADLAILSKNPLEDIRNTMTTKYVIKDGFVYDADTLEKVDGYVH
jgi:imidazolonepropionase-like amidohydrolase